MVFKMVLPYQERLFKFVIEPEICSRCGACAGVCPTECISFSNNEPFIRVQCDLTEKCGFCWSACPKVNPTTYGPRPFGDYLEIFSAQSQHVSLAQDGGVTTKILENLFELGEIDGAIVSGFGKNGYWVPQPYIAHNSDELHNSFKSKYTFSPNLSLIWRAITKEKMSKIAVVGLPCQIDAVRLIQNNDKIPKIFKNRIRLTIGLFCTSNFTYSQLFGGLLKSKNIEARDVMKMDIKNSKFIVKLKGKNLKIPLKIVKPYEDNSCHYCKDLTAESADISIGSIGSKAGWNTVILRTPLGKDLFYKSNSGITRQELYNFDILVKLSQKKFENANEFSIQY